MSELPPNLSTLVDLLQFRASVQPHQRAYTFLIDGELDAVHLTYAELDAQARMIGATLQAKGLAGERALLLYPPGLEFIAAFFGCLYAGIVAIPTYPPKRNRPDQRMQAIVADAQATVALTTGAMLANLESHLAHVPMLREMHWLATDEIEDALAAAWQVPSVDGQSLAFLQYTSGSTGTPKGVMVSHGNILANEEMIQHAFGHSEQTIFAGWLPVFHDMGLVGNVLQPLYLGIPCTLMSPIAFLQKPVRWLQAISRYSATTSGGPNFAYDLCVRKVTPEQCADLDLSSWTVAFNGAEPVRAKTLERFTKAFKPYGFSPAAFYPCYGMAETTLFVTGGLQTELPITTHVDRAALEEGKIVTTPSNEQESFALVSSGRHWLDEEVLIVDPETAVPCPPDRVGEIWVSGEHLAQGYWQQEEATQETFEARLAHAGSGPYLRTGDLGFLQDGELFVTGRHKDLIILNGRNYYPQDIELTVEESHPALHRGCGVAFSIEDENTEKLVIVQEIQRTYLRNLDSAGVFKAIRQAVAYDHSLEIEDIVLLKTTAMPKTSSGKLQRRACRAMYLADTLQEIAREQLQPQAATSNLSGVDETAGQAEASIAEAPVTDAAVINAAVVDVPVVDVPIVDAPVSADPETNALNVGATSTGMEFSLMYFSSQEAEYTTDKYCLFVEGARWADEHNFTAIWTPERHFHAFGGLYPNPSVLSAALATITNRIRLRAGSVVLPLHHPVRVVEEWAVVDNLSQGRVDLAVAQGWNPNDFILAPDNYEDRIGHLLSGIETMRQLWRGESLTFPNGKGAETDVRVYPLPQQPELAIWLTCSGSIERFVDAGAAGVNILTALLFQSVEELAEKLAAYRTARAENGHDPTTGHVTLMLHTFVAEDMDFVRDTVRPPLIEYLKTSVNLWRHGAKSLDDLTSSEQENLLNYAFERYFRMSGLFGTPESCQPMVEQLQQVGVDEIACLCDFIPDTDVVLNHLPSLDRLRQLMNAHDSDAHDSDAHDSDAHDSEKSDRIHDSVAQREPEVATAQEAAVQVAPTNLHVNQLNGTGSTAAPEAESTVGSTAPKHSDTNVPSFNERQLLRQIQGYLRQRIARTLSRSTDEIDLTRDFRSLGVNSLKAIDLMNGLGEEVGVTLSPTVLFESPTIGELAQYFVDEHGLLWHNYLQDSDIQSRDIQNSDNQSCDIQNKEDNSSADHTLTEVELTKAVSHGSIDSDDQAAERAGDMAVIGLACHFPQASNLEEYWSLLSEGRSAIQEVPADRWPAQAYYDATGQNGRKTYSRWGGFLDDLDLFDPNFFGISPREARLMDPQQRIFLEVAWQTVQHAGYAPQAIPQTGVFVGCSNTNYYERIRPQLTVEDASAGVGNQNAIIANRVSYHFNFNGPSLVVDTMCSSSLVALHLARQSLLSGECETALVGGVNALLSPEYYVAMSRMKAHSFDGRCKTFDQDADGIVFGEGAGAILLKPFAAAQADGDTIYATIKGSAVNHGGRANGLTAPNPRAQAELVAAALEEANVTADSISYVEAHGTGTALGDPIEIEGLTQAFRRQTDARNFCAIGSVKTNIGHLEPAAGIAGLVKVVLSLQNEALPPSLNFSQPNPLIPFAESPFYVNTKLTPWAATDAPRRAGLSGFGIGGNNAHIIIEEAPASSKSASSKIGSTAGLTGERASNESAMQDKDGQLLTLSAKTENGLYQTVADYAQFLSQTPADLADICGTSNVSRATLPHRLAILAQSKPDLQTKLTALASGEQVKSTRMGIIPQETPPLVFLFTGQGAQAPDMGRRLYETQQVFRSTLDKCDEILRPHLDHSLIEIMYPQEDEQAELIHQTRYAQPALFALEYSLAQMWASWGIVPDMVLGHSLGELIAACVAGVFDLEEGLEFVAKRGQLMQSLPDDGLMATLFGPYQTIANLVAPQAENVSVAAINGPTTSVISGETMAVNALLKQAEQEGIDYRLLLTSHAFHSPLLEPIVADMLELAQTLPNRVPQIPLMTNLSGRPWPEGMGPDAQYWVNQMRSPVQFAAAMEYLFQQGYSHFLEVGPTPTLLKMGKRCADENRTLAWYPTLNAKQDDWHVLLEAVSQLYVQGFPIEWEALHAGHPYQRVALPAYPFEHRRFWADLPTAATRGPDHDTALANDGLEKQSDMKRLTAQTESDTLISDMALHSQPTSHQPGTATQPIAMAQSTPLDQRQYVLDELSQLMAGLLEVDHSEINIHQSFMEMGADSLLLINAVHKIEAQFGVRIKMRQFFDEIPTLDAAVSYIDSQVTLDLSPAIEQPTVPGVESTPMQPAMQVAVEDQAGVVQDAVPQTTGVQPAMLQTGPTQTASNELTTLFAQQLAIIQSQLDLLGQRPAEQTTLPPAVAPQQPTDHQPTGHQPSGHQPTVGQSTQQNQPLPAVMHNHSGPAKNGAMTHPATTYSNGTSANGNPQGDPLVPSPQSSQNGADGTKAFSSLRPKDTLTGLTEEQETYLAVFREQYIKKTAHSKRITQMHRSVLADNRASASFRPSLKEFVYPISATGGKGCRIWDVDGNAFIDICMGYGVNLFGHNPSFVEEALEKQLKEGWVLGPQSPLAGEVAQLIHDLTGMERSAFCNSGTEAVMTAIRLARAKTERNKIVIFSGSYHGTFDGILAMADPNDPLSSRPVASGVTPSLINDVMVLDYDKAESLELIRDHAHEIAAVLVEPVQSRHPNLQPQHFLHQLRQLTQEHDVALIFDEMITGFRIHPGGAQAHFGIAADLATYGKVVGGGLPIGVVAGKADYMDRLDGGMWRFGDDSYPAVDTTFFAGTFCKHPLAMTAAHAVLTQLKEEGPALQSALNERTERLATTLNDYFTQEELPISIVYFGSLFRFDFRQNLDLFFYHLLAKGVYVWEGRNFFLSTAHTDEDIDILVQAVQESILELRAGGFLPPRPPHLPSPPHVPSPPTNGLRSDNYREQVNAVPSVESVAPDTSGAPVATVRLTAAQQHLWILDQINQSGSVAYNESLLMKLDGALVIEQISAALQQVVARHEALRTVIDASGESQHILPTMDVPMTVVDFVNPDAQGQKAALEQWLTEESRKPFDLVHGPLMRTAMVKVAADQHLFLLTVHHIVADGMSVGILLQEMVQAYEALGQGNMVQLPTPMPFSDYVRRQLAARHSPEMQQHATYWHQQFAQEPPVLELPSDKPRPPVMSYQGGRHSAILSGALTEALKRFCKQERVTPFMALLALYTLLLHRLSGQDDLVVGFPVAGRGEGEFESLVGYCTHMAPIRSQLVGNPSFADYLKQIRDLALDAFEHQAYTFAWLLDELKMERDTSRPPLITAGFNLDSSVTLPEVPGLQLAYQPMPLKQAKFDLDLNVTESAGELFLDLEYNSDIFLPETIARWMNHFECLLNSVLTDVTCPVQQVALLTTQERDELIWERNQTVMPFPQTATFSELFEEQVVRTPDRIAAVCGEQKLTYAELNVAANRLAYQLVKEQVGPEVVVALLADRSLEFLIAVLGIFKAGGAYLPLDPRYPAARIGQIIEQSQAPLVLMTSKFSERVAESLAGIASTHKPVALDINQLIESEISRENLPSRAEAQTLAYVIYTSGSTGKPKGAMVEQVGMINHLYAKINDLDLVAEDIIAQTASQCFDISVWQFLVGLIMGGETRIYDDTVAYDPPELIRQVADDQVTILETVPSLLRAMLDGTSADGIQLSTDGNPETQNSSVQNGGYGALRWLLITGEAAPPELCRVWLTQYPETPMLNAYGPTECSDDVTHYRIDTVAATDVMNMPIGRPVGNMQMYILDEHLEPVPQGVQGELYVGGIGVGRGYLYDSERTAAAFMADPFQPGGRFYKTGDLARYLPDGNIEYLGRIDFQVKIRGCRIELGEIETALTQHPQVRDAVVTVQKNPAADKVLVAYVTKSMDTEAPTIPELRRFMQSKLPMHMAPSFYLVLEQLPLTPNGKIDRKRLPLPDFDSMEERAITPLESDTEKLLGALWVAALGIERVGRHDNFFALGGDSIIAIQITRKAAEQGISISPTQLFQYPTIAELALVSNDGPLIEAEQTPVVGTVELTPIQKWFWDQGLATPSHYNQALWVQIDGQKHTSQPLTVANLEEALQQIVLHHDAFRLRFYQEDGVWQQVSGPVDEPSQLVTEVDLRTLSPEEQTTPKLVVADAMQASLDLENGPLLRAILFRTDQGDELLLLAHHLVVDGVSWRIVLEDLERLYKQAAAGEELSLLPKSTSYQLWAQKLQAYAHSSAVLEQLPYWVDQLGTTKLPVDHSGEMACNIVSSEQNVTVTLDEHTTAQLLHEVLQPYRTNVQELCVTALGQTLQAWSGAPSHQIDLEAHGREALFDDVDLTRTVGWFTSLFPTQLMVKETEPGEAILAVKEHLRTIPQNGIGWGLLRYLSPLAQQLQEAQPSPVVFNYLGQFDQLFDESELFEPLLAETGQIQSPESERTHLIEINAMIVNKELRVTWTYSRNIHAAETMTHLADSFMNNLQALIAHCLSPEAGGYTTVDFPLANLSQEELAHLAQLIEESDSLSIVTAAE
ncbi:MAG: amino acid adenylation domain-containing protein [Chloroflexota bacterium]